MDNEVYVLELNKKQLEGLNSALDAAVKAHGIAVAQKCGELFNILQNATLKSDDDDAPKRRR